MKLSITLQNLECDNEWTIVCGFFLLFFKSILEMAKISPYQMFKKSDMTKHLCFASFLPVICGNDCKKKIHKTKMIFVSCHHRL